MEYEIGNPEMSWLLLFAPVALILIGYSGWRNRTALAQFGTQPTIGRSIRGTVSALALVCGLMLLAVACMDIRWGKTTRTVPQKGLEVVFALDVSRSMLAQDARPTRLARAKQQINDMVGEMAGDRIGLVVFAGEAKQAIPLTNHYNDFREKLDSVGPQTVAKGGSQLGVAIEAAAEAFLSKTNDHKTVVLFTDGEDQESKPVELARKLFAESEMRIFTVGLGDMDKGARIPQDRQQSQLSGQFVEHAGQQVWSKLNGSVLRQIATETKAAYIPAGTKRVDMADVYHNYIANVQQTEFETAKVNAYIPRFQWFAFPALVCLLIHGWLSTMRNQNMATRSAASSNRLRASTTSTIDTPTKSKRKSRSKVAASVAAALLVLLPDVAQAQSTEPAVTRTVAEQINAANDHVRRDSNSAAIEAFNRIQAKSQNERDALNYNLAIAHYGNSDIEAAGALFSQSAKSTDDRIAADSRYNLGNCHFAKSLNLEQKLDAAIQELESAVTQYRSAIRIDRQHAAARENLERAVKLIKQLKNDQQSEEEEQDKDQSKESEEDQEQNSNEKSERSGDDRNPNQDQDQDQDQNQDPNQNQDQGNSEQEPSSSSNDQSATDPNSDSEPDGDESSKGESSQEEESEAKSSESQNESDEKTESDPPSAQDSEDQSQQAQESSSNAQNNEPQEPKPEQSDQGEAPPEGEISAADESESQSGDKNQQPLLDPDIESEEDGVMSRQEALKLLQSVRDRDMLRRLRQQQRQRSRRVQVEKDW